MYYIRMTPLDIKAYIISRKKAYITLLLASTLVLQPLPWCFFLSYLHSRSTLVLFLVLFTDALIDSSLFPVPILKILNNSVSSNKKNENISFLRPHLH